MLSELTIPTSVNDEEAKTGTLDQADAFKKLENTVPKKKKKSFWHKDK